MNAMIMYSRSVKCSWITSPIRPPTLRNRGKGGEGRGGREGGEGRGGEGRGGEGGAGRGKDGGEGRGREARRGGEGWRKYSQVNATKKHKNDERQQLIGREGS